MLTRTSLIAAAATLALSGAAVADEAKGPTVMTDDQMDQLVAGDYLGATANPSGRVVWIDDHGQYYNPNNGGHGRPFGERGGPLGPFGVPPNDLVFWNLPQGNWSCCVYEP